MSQSSEIIDITNEIFSQVRTTIVLNMRFLDMAVFRLKPIPQEISLATDGQYLYYDPVHLIKRYRAESNAVTRDYLHVLLHCIFRHPFVNTLVDQPLWNLACDIAVEALICEFNQKDYAIRAETKRSAVIDGLKLNVKPFTAEKLYHHFQNHAPRASWHTLFSADDHSIWYQRKKPTPDDDPDDENERGDDANNKDPQDNNTQDNDTQMQMPNQGLEKEWRDVSEHIQMDMETFSKQQGARSGGMQQMLAELNRERYNYEAFLKKFAVMGETMKINDDEFDYIYYTYGMKLFGNMPLIEPLEYKEVGRIREFAIAIDTSASTSGELVQKFLQKTYNILKSTESFFSKINLHIIQCDAKIQEDVKITSQAEFDEYLKHMTIKGLGGTDFRPVFQYVDRLIAAREFARLKGLIYFTDGFGAFPSNKPDYNTAFVFIQDEWNNLNVPPWAIKLILEKDEI